MKQNLIIGIFLLAIVGGFFFTPVDVSAHRISPAYIEGFIAEHPEAPASQIQALKNELKTQTDIEAVCPPPHYLTT